MYTNVDQVNDFIRRADIDALAVATRLYTGLHVALNREVSPSENYICSINSLVSGTAANIVPDEAVAQFYFRAAKKETVDELLVKVKKIAEGAALMTGAELTMERYELPYNDLVTNENLSAQDYAVYTISYYLVYRITPVILHQ